MKKRILLTILTLLLTLTLLPATAQAATTVASGSCGSGVSWVLDSEGTLTISGRGEMKNYNSYNNPSPWDNYKKQIKTAVIKSGIKNIGDNAFEDCSFLTTVTIPNSVTSIGEHAFSDCSSLISVSIPNNVTNIGAFAFYDCESLVDINIPSKIKVIESYTFGGCKSLTSITIPNSVTSIGEGAFVNCYSLVSVTIPSSVTNIEDRAFCCDSFYNPKLQYIEFLGNAPTVGENVFSCNLCYHNGASGWTSPTWNGYKTACPDLPITDYSTLDADNRNAQGIIFTLNDTSKTAVVGDGSGDDNNSGYQGTGNFTVVIPDQVMKDGVAYKVNGVVANAFSNNPVVKSITLGKNVSSLGSQAFSGCSNLTEITVDADSKFFTSEDGILYDKMKMQLYAYPAGKADKEFTVPDTVRTINQYAFGGAENLRSIIVPDTVTAIQQDAFYNCNGLEEITLPFIGDSAAGNHTFTYVMGTSKRYGSIDVWPVPESLKKVTITGGTLPKEAFYEHYIGLMNIEEIYLPAYENLTVIPEGCFSKCYSLNKVTFGDEDDGLPLGSIRLPEGVTTIQGDRYYDDGAFYNCQNLKNIEFPNSLKSIGNLAFANSGLEQVDLPASVTSIGISAFRACSNLQNFNVDEANTNFSSDQWGVLFNKDKSELMYYPSARKWPYYNVPESVRTIDESAFYGSKNLVNLFIPQEVTNINSAAPTLCCWQGSAADTYASSHNITSWYMDNYTMQGIEVYHLPDQFELTDEGLSLQGLYMVANYGGKELQLDDYSVSYEPINEDVLLVTVESQGHTANFRLRINGLLGDVNEDEKVDILDVLRLLNHVNGSDPLKDVSLGYITEGDEEINILDVLRLLNHVNGSDPLY